MKKGNTCLNQIENLIATGLFQLLKFQSIPYIAFPNADVNQLIQLILHTTDYSQKLPSQ